MLDIVAWYGVLLLLGLAALPLTRLIFCRADDGGWLFSRVTGWFLAGLLMWLANVTQWLPFTAAGCFFTAAAVLSLSLILLIVKGRRGSLFRDVSPKVMLTEELIFAGIFAGAVYLIGFRPEAFGTEKLMDYAFITACLRSDTMPFIDPWYSGCPVNYYYGGQYMTAYLIRLAGTTAGMGYNLMRATLWAMSLTLPFSLVRMMKIRAGGGRAGAAGVLSGLAVGACANGHYLVFGLVIPLLDRLTGGRVSAAVGLDGGSGSYHYWFPSSTRYIGYFPETSDKTIHEFPAYSSVLGDLHAHYIDLIFVLTAAAILYAYAVRREEMSPSPHPTLRCLLREALADPALILAGVMIGAFRWTNYWDYPIYTVIAAAVIIFVQLKKHRRDILRFLVNTVTALAFLWGIGYLVSLPFMSRFTMIASQISRVSASTPFYQLMILWGVPALMVIGLFVLMLGDYRESRAAAAEGVGKVRRRGAFLRLLAQVKTEDLTVLIFGAGALGLILIPELVYVKDIYGSEYARANTMFKLTYQSFILLGIVTGYVLMRAFDKRGRLRRVMAGLGIGYVLLTALYTGNAVNSWFRPLDTERTGTDASVFIDGDFASDYGAVNYLNTYAEDRSVVLEAPGDSYSGYGRVSAATGLPTVLGWYVHEWLWRGDTADLNARAADIEAIYTSQDAAEVRALIEKYHISYIYIGALERQKYPLLNDKLLQSLGSVAYSDGVTTYIMKMDG